MRRSLMRALVALTLLGALMHDGAAAPSFPPASGVRSGVVLAAALPEAKPRGDAQTSSAAPSDRAAARAGAPPSGTVRRLVAGVPLPPQRPAVQNDAAPQNDAAVPERSAPLAASAYAATDREDPVASLFASVDAALQAPGEASDGARRAAEESAIADTLTAYAAERALLPLLAHKGAAPARSARAVDAVPVASIARVGRDVAAPAPVATSAPARLRIPFVPDPAGDPFAAYASRDGTLGEALDALRADRYREALERRNGLGDPLDRKIVDYFLIRSGTPLVTSALVADFARRAPGWPSQDLWRSRAEEALVRERPAPDDAIAALEGTAQTAAGLTLLARSHLAKGNEAAARRAVRALWHARPLGLPLQSALAGEFGALLAAEDHLRRADKLLALDKLAEAGALRGLLDDAGSAYVAARVAAAEGSEEAAALLRRVPPALRTRAGYRLAEVEHLRRREDFAAAARLILAAPRDRIVDGDPWWVEARIVARSLAERGEGRLGYELVTRGFAEGRVERADEAFHAGWFALEELGDGAAAEAHFARLAEIATTPLSRSRAAYWRGRAATRRGDPMAASRHFADAARDGFTYYGQLARAATARAGTAVADVPQPSEADRAAMASNEVAEAVRRLLASGHGRRALPLLRHLGDTLTTPGELKIAVDLAHRAGQPHVALMVAKAAQRRGVRVGRLAYPVDAIPRDAPLPDGLDRALVYAIARQESMFNPTAVSPAGARGLMQVMPATAKTMARRLGLSHSARKLIADPAYNATLGAAYLDRRLGEFDGSYVLTFAAYNAGAGRVREWIERFGDPRDPTIDVVAWVERIPFPETRNYVQRVMENVQVYREALGTGQLAIREDLERGRPG